LPLHRKREPWPLLFFPVGFKEIKLKVEDGYDLWLRYDPLEESIAAAYREIIKEVTVVGKNAILDSVRKELERALPSLLGESLPIQDRLTGKGQPVLLAGTYKDLIANGMEGEILFSQDLCDEGFRIFNLEGKFSGLCVCGADPVGVLYGIFALLRRMQLGQSLTNLDIAELPKLQWRMMNHWDNLDGSIERGYAGETLWQWDELPGKVDPRYTDYARACASVGLNASVLNNVNTQPEILSSEYLEKVQAIAEVLRRYGIRTFLSVNFASPVSLGGLSTADPADQAVKAWWKEKADEIYRQIPDFGGFLVKADSEGQPGPYAYGRTHAEGANMLGEALASHDGKVIWRAFVYGHGENDRAKKAYADFKPLDGEFLPNVAVQVKNGAIDFQPREPVHPLFGGMDKTTLFMEFQIAQEYLGQGNHIVYLGPMWKEILDFDTHAEGPGSTVGKILARDVSGRDFTGIAAVTNTGDDRDWCGSLFHPQNWYAYGRLAWDYELDPAEIAKEWIGCTFGLDEELNRKVLDLMMSSWQACVEYMTPLCLHHIMREHHHYGPDPGFDAGAREDWRSSYYHRADSEGLGFDRTRAGSAGVDQYHKPVADMFNDIESCPEKYLLWFHHVPWGRIMKSGRTMKEELVFLYDRGVASAEKMRETWVSLKNKVDSERYKLVLDKLDIQVKDAHEWRDVCTNYFLAFAQ